jgi:PEGA domain
MSQPQPPDKGDDSPPPQKPLASWYAQGLSDGVGDRLLMFDNSDAPSLELLRVRPELAVAPGFEEALRERVQNLSGFRHPSFARVRAVENLEPDDSLAVISNYTPGKRLSEVLHQANGPRFAKALIRQLAPALALLQQESSGLGHGTLNLDRIVITPEGRLTIVEYVLGTAIETLGLNPGQLAELGIPVPASSGDGSAALDASTDIFQLGLIALSVLLGRPLETNEQPQAAKLLGQFAEAAERDGVAFSPLLHHWIERALQLDGKKFESLEAAHEALAELLQEDPSRPAIAGRSAKAQPPPAVQQPPPRRPEPIVAAPRPSRPAESIQPAPAPPRVSDQGFARRAVDPRRPDLDQPTAQARTLFDYETPSAGRKPGASYAELRDGATERFEEPQPAEQVRSQTARPRVVARTLSFGPAFAALALLCTGEAVVIASLVYRAWFTPPQPIVVETTASGADVLVEGHSTGKSQLRLTVAPDMRWIRVVGSTPSAGAIAGKTGGPDASIQISSPIDVQIFENDRLLGSAPGARLDVAPGRHALQIVNLALGYELRQTVDIEAGQTVSLYVAPADGLVNLDAQPGTEASIDGKPVGRAPIANLALPLGEHEFTFRHPQLGQDRQKVIVKSDAVTRVTANLRR